MTRVKICGITSMEDAELAAGMGAWALGMIFWPESPRKCAPAEAERIGAAMHRRLEVVGVFVNATLDDVALEADRASLSIVQLHGDEGPAYCREAARRTGAKVMKAVRVRDASHVHALRSFHTDLHLLDAYVTGSRGGTGESFNWDLARGHRGPAHVVLSGGLTAENVGRAIEVVHPYAVDTASGTEAEPGVKDPAKVRAFFHAVEVADGRAAA
jgi:phosphoribosylanthranilate isomerase